MSGVVSSASFAISNEIRNHDVSQDNNKLLLYGFATKLNVDIYVCFV